MDGRTDLELDRPRSATELLQETLRLFGRYPLLFPTLAAGVVIPYLLIVLLITGDGPFEYRDNLTFVAGQVLNLSSMILVWPMVSALHVHAVRDVADGNQPRLGSVARRGLLSLPVVAGAVAISWIGTLAGFVALIVPGFLLWLRWSVVAQTAALDGGSPIDALRRSASLTRGNYPHVFALLLLVGLITGVPSFLIGLPFRHSDPTVGSFLVGSAVQVLAASFGALGSAVLYFDLKARVGVESATPAPVVHALDPRSFTDEDRPPAWYIDPSRPKVMRYWFTDPHWAWSEQTTGTPKQTLHEWEMLRERGEEGKPRSISGRVVEPTGHPLDPASYSDEDRPPGWYVDPDAPWSMRYWAADGTPTWGKDKAKTPKETLANWRDLRWKR